MAPVGRYLRNEAAFKPDAYAVLKTHFEDRRAFNRFYAAISKPKLNDFLRVCVSYRYLAKHGDWKIKVRGYNPVIDYLTNSYKLVAVFSLIESLSDLGYMDFYQWLTAKIRKQSFPIEGRKALEKLYREYKADYGATRRCVAFFCNLPLEEQRRLCGSISVSKKPVAEITKLAEFLYNLRSGFVHKAEFAHELNGPTFVITKAGLVESKLTVADIFRAFELGVIEHFRGET
jgi:hypothetical protein